MRRVSTKFVPHGSLCLTVLGEEQSGPSAPPTLLAWPSSVRLLFYSHGWRKLWKGSDSVMWMRWKKIRWWPWRVFRVKSSRTVSSSGENVGTSALTHMENTLKGTKIFKCKVQYNWLQKIIPVIFDNSDSENWQIKLKIMWWDLQQERKREFSKILSYSSSHCCWWPIIDPGRHIRIHAIVSCAEKW
jgi:hypothetical protein